MNNADKHRLLTVVSSATFMDELTMDSPEPPDTRKHNISVYPQLMRLTRAGVELASVGSDDPTFNPQAKFAAQIVFESLGPLEMRPVVAALKQAVGVVEAVGKSLDDDFW